MTLRPARCFRNNRPWTRTAVRKPDKAYVVGVPDSKLRIFEMGTKSGSYDLQIDLVISEKSQIRDNALESARVIMNKTLEANLPGSFFFMIRKYPHQCLREHHMLTGAGADRLSRGMSLAFGRPVGRAALVRKGDVLMSVWTFKRFEGAVRAGFKKAGSKLPCGCKYVATYLKNS